MRAEMGKFEGVYWLRNDMSKLSTRNLTPGRNIYGERLEVVDDIEYREWDPYRSKLAAALHKGIRAFPFQTGSKVLYLGAGSGTTASHVSDIVGNDGTVFCVEVAYRPMRDLLTRLAKARENVVAILGDARHPHLYRWMVEECDVTYCDISQQDQTSIMLGNADRYLKPGGHAIIAVKARSISSVLPLEEIYGTEARRIEGAGYGIVEEIDLEPYSDAHRIITAIKK
jgi:fibrillarin-like pre-rRNA processing protein